MRKFECTKCKQVWQTDAKKYVYPEGEGNSNIYQINDSCLDVECGGTIKEITKN